MIYLLRTELIFYHATINPLPKEQNSGLLVVPRIAKSTKGGRTFSYLAPKLWNIVLITFGVQTHSLCFCFTLWRLLRQISGDSSDFSLLKKEEKQFSLLRQMELLYER